MTARLSSPETAREHLRNAIQLLQSYRDDVVERPLAVRGMPIPSRELRAIEARCYRALEQIEAGNP